MMEKGFWLWMFTGVYEEKGRTKLDLRQVFWLCGMLLVVWLGYDAFFVQSFQWDNWGMISTYQIKLGYILLSMVIIYYMWGHSRLLKRVQSLERMALERSRLPQDERFSNKRIVSSNQLNTREEPNEKDFHTYPDGR